MSWVAMLFVVTLTFWAGTMLYAWATTYPMFRDIGAAEFVAVHKTYERGLPVGVYGPFGLMGVAVVVTASVQPSDVPVEAIWTAAAALLGGVVTTGFCAAPLHIKLIRTGKDARRIERMLACNSARTIAAFVGLGASIWTLAAA